MNLQEFKMRYISPYRLGWYFVFVEATLIIITALDKLVHQTLYLYKLQFAYAWADVYWGLLYGLYQLIGIGFAITYLISSSKPSKYLAFLLYYTINIQLLGGWLDTFFFMIHGRFPPDPVWWWNPFNRFLGVHWDAGTNIMWNILWIGVTIALWSKYYYERNSVS